MNQLYPKITVGMPVYNGEPFLREAIESALCQTYEDFELVISDNASTDGTREICEDYAANDPRICYHRNKANIGAARNYNTVFRLARGAYFRWFNADDLIAPHLHEECVKVLDGNPDAVLCYGKTEIIDGHGRCIGSYDDNLDLQDAQASNRFKRFYDQVGLTNVIYGLMRSDAMRKTALFGDGSLPAADTRFMAELTLQGKFIEIPQVLFYRRMHPEASSHQRDDIARQRKFWSADSKEFTLPKLRLRLSLLRSAFKADIVAREKLRIACYICRQMYWEKKAIACELAGSPLRRSWP